MKWLPHKGFSRVFCLSGHTLGEVTSLLSNANSSSSLGTEGSGILHPLPALFVHLLLLLGWQMVWDTAREEDCHAKGPPQHRETIVLGKGNGKPSLLALPSTQHFHSLCSASSVHVSGLVMPLERIHEVLREGHAGRNTKGKEELYLLKA